MKTNLLFVILAVFILASCADKPGYQINGKVNGDMTGKTVYLKKIENFQPSTLMDSAVIENGTFIIQGTVSEAGAYNLSIKDEKYNMDIFIENHPIQVIFDSDDFRNSSVTGSPLNDTYAQYIKGMSEHQGKIQDVSRRLREARQAQEDKILTPEAKSSYNTQYNEATKELRDYQYNFVINHPNSIVSAYILQKIAVYLEPQQLEEALSKFDSGFTNTDYLLAVNNDLDKIKKVALGQPYTDLSMLNPMGQEIKLSDYVGKAEYVLVDFWASWCPDCLEENPILVKLYNEYKNKGLEIVGVSFDNNKDNWVKRIEKDKMVWPQMSDLAGWKSQGAQIYNIKYIPGNILINKEGTIIAKDIYDSEMTNKIAELLK